MSRLSISRSGMRSRPSLPATPPSATMDGKTRQPSLLAGMLFDGDGNRMTPSHAVKKGTRYRYYVSRSLITRDRTELRRAADSGRGDRAAREPAECTDGFSIPAASTNRLRHGSPTHQYSSGLSRGPQISASSWPELPVARKRAVLTALIERIEVRADQIDIRLRPASAGRAPRCCCDTLAEHDRRRNPDPVGAGAPAPRRAGDQDGDRRGGSVRRGETRRAIDQAAPQGAPVQRDTRGSEGVPFAALAEREGVRAKQETG